MHLKFVRHPDSYRDCVGGAYDRFFSCRNGLTPAFAEASAGKQILRVMKLTAIFLTVVALQVSATGKSQTVTLDMKNVSVQKVFKEVIKQTGVSILYDIALLDQVKPVTIKVKDAPLAEVMTICFTGQPIEWSIDNGVVLIKERPAFFVKLRQQDQAPVGFAETIPLPANISGRVTNNVGEPLNGTSVIIKRTGKGTITNANGEFSLKHVNSDDTLVVSYTGYTTLNIRVGERTNFVLLMNISNNKLDEIVVQAYGNTSDRLRTGNISRITSDDIAKQPVMNVLDVLQGQATGTLVTHNNGYASGTVKVEIRGRNSIDPNFPSDPLYIIDGVPLTILDIANGSTYNTGSQGFILSGIVSPATGQSPFFSINPADIESIEVLKDADATAIYGSRASNGVILITTKKGKAGKTHFDLNLYHGITRITNRYALLNTQQYVSMRNEALANDGQPVDANTAADLAIWDTTRYTNWQDKLWGGTGSSTDLQASMSGGDNRTSFRLSGGYQREQDVTAASGASQRVSLSSNFNHKSLNQKLKTTLVAAYSYASADMIVLPGIATMSPNAPAIYTSTGKLNWDEWTAGNSYNQFGSLFQPYTTKTNFLNSNLAINYEIIRGLTVKVNVGYNDVVTKQNVTYPIVSVDPITNPTGAYLVGNNTIRNLISEPLIEYNGYVGKGKINVLAGSSFQANKTSSIRLQGSGYTNDALLTSISNAPVKAMYSYDGQYKYASIFARINYNWENRYLINLNGRRDGSSRFGPNKQWGNFGSVGAGWIFSEAKWIKRNVPFISYGKIRGSYGSVGGDKIRDYQYLTQWLFSNLTYNGSLALGPTKHTDSLLHWEVNRKAEIGVELGFLNDKISVSASWYRNRCGNQLINFILPSLTGFSVVTTNNPATVQNVGLEFIVGATLVDKKNLKLRSKINLSINRNKLLSYPGLSESPYANSLVLGKTVNIRKLLHHTGVDPQTGLNTYGDKNKDGIINDNPGPNSDFFDIDVNPKFDGGFVQDFSYKSWEVNLFFYFRKQVGQNAFSSIGIPGRPENQPLEVYNNHWKKPGDIAKYARFTSNSPGATDYWFTLSDAIITDASFIRLQNVSISYDFSKRLLKLKGIQGCKLFVRAQNLFVITSYKGSD
ncbi:MAG TPA: SusC/RagA family TonB-linked outer membrane protein, partial [Chitinophagaceae bacterium]|nr:SusC/RagA family TonB-linked outer membrane protein [Chitinophagaceae bacterium]